MIHLREDIAPGVGGGLAGVDLARSSSRFVGPEPIELCLVGLNRPIVKAVEEFDSQLCSVCLWQREHLRSQRVGLGSHAATIQRRRHADESKASRSVSTVPGAVTARTLRYVRYGWGSTALKSP